MPDSLSDPIVQAEQVILATLLEAPDMIHEACVDEIGPDDFYDVAASAIFEGCLRVRDRGSKLTYISLTDALKKNGQLSVAGGPEALWSLKQDARASLLPDSAELKSCIQQVVEASRRRALRAAASEIAQKAARADTSIDALIDEAEGRFLKIGQGRRSDTMSPIADIMHRVGRDMAPGAMRQAGLRTGFDSLDRMTGGLKPGQLWILAARPGVGKSAMALQMAVHVARQGRKSVFMSYEMSAMELGYRALSGETGMNASYLSSGDVPDEARPSLDASRNILAQLPLVVDDQPPPTISALRSAVHRSSRGHVPLGAVFVDYLQLMESTKRKDSTRNDEVSDITRGLKLLAVELEVPVVALSQLNRGVENRGNRRPQLHDLRDSGSIEQDANAVVFLYRELHKHDADHSRAEIIVAKQRSGPTGIIHAVFNGDCTEFSEAADSDADGF